MRTNGFEKPFSKDQVTSWVLQPLLMSCFIAFVAKLLDRDKCLAILIPNAVLVLILLASWTICESRNPAEPKRKSTLSCLRVPPKQTRYCTICCKHSPGLDHHCTWLNTCIGENNYEAFYCLVVTAAAQTLGQAVIGVLMATLWFDDVQRAAPANTHDALLALLWVHNALCLGLANSYVLLAGFHTYLLYVGTGTYDFILANGSDGLCARLLKCKCLRWSKAKKTKPKLSHVVSDDSKPSGSGTSKATTPQLVKTAVPTTATTKANQDNADAKAAADKKQQDIAQWKAEWAAKYGADDSDDSVGNAPSAKPPAAAANKIEPEPSETNDAAVGPPKSLLLLVAGDKVSARRTSTYPAELVSSASTKSCVGESQVRMSLSIHHSDDVLDAAAGPKTEL